MKCKLSAANNFRHATGPSDLACGSCRLACELGVSGLGVDETKDKRPIRIKIRSALDKLVKARFTTTVF